MSATRIAAFAAAAWLGLGLSPAVAADASGVAASGSAGATSTLPGPAAQPGTGEVPLEPGRGIAAGASGITEEQVRQSLEAAGYADVEVKREGADWVARGTLNGAPQRLRIDSKTGQPKR